MIRLSLFNISFISSVFIVFLLVLYLTQPPPPPLLRYRRQLGPFPGYKDCKPATQVAFLHNTQGRFSKVVENILGRLALTYNLSYHMDQVGLCKGIFVGINVNQTLAFDSEDHCSLSSHRDAIGDEPFIVTLLGEAETIVAYTSEDVKQVNNETEDDIEKLDKIVDLGIVVKQFTESLIVLKHLLCLDFRDITHIDSTSGEVIKDINNEYIHNHFQRKLQKILAELEEDVVDREISILEHANCNLRAACNQTRPERYAGVADTTGLNMCHLMKYNVTDFTKLVP